MRAINISLLMSVLLLSSSVALGHARGEFDKFGGKPDQVKEFRGLLDQEGRLTEAAISYWLRKGGHLEPDLFTDGGDPKEGVLKFRKIESRAVKGQPIAERWIVEVVGDDGIARPKYEIERSANSKEIAKKLQAVNDKLAKVKWADKEKLFNDLPQLAELKVALAYKTGLFAESVFLLYFAPAGIRASLLLNDGDLESDKVKTDTKYAGKAFGSLHVAFAKNLDDEEEITALNKLQTLIHGNAIEDNVSVDRSAKKHKVTLSNIQDLGFGTADKDIDAFVGKGLATRARVYLEAIHEKKDVLEEDPESSNAGKLRGEIEGLKGKFWGTIGLVEVFVDAYTSEFPEKFGLLFNAGLRNTYVKGLKEDFNKNFGSDTDKKKAKPSKKSKAKEDEESDAGSDIEGIESSDFDLLGDDQLEGEIESDEREGDEGAELSDAVPALTTADATETAAASEDEDENIEGVEAEEAAATEEAVNTEEGAEAEVSAKSDSATKDAAPVAAAPVAAAPLAAAPAAAATEAAPAAAATATAADETASAAEATATATSKEAEVKTDAKPAPESAIAPVESIEEEADAAEAEADIEDAAEGEAEEYYELEDESEGGVSTL